MKYLFLFLGLFIYAFALLASFVIPIDDSLPFVFPSIIVSLLIVYYSGIEKKGFTTILLYLIYIIILGINLVQVYNSIDIHKNEYKRETDRVVIIPYNFQGCIQILYPGGDSSNYGKCTTIVRDNKEITVRIKDTIIVDDNGLAISPLTQLGSSLDYEFYLSDIDKKLKKIILLKGIENHAQILEKLPAILPTMFESENNFNDYKGDSIYYRAMEVARFYLYNKDTCNCNMSTEGRNVDSAMTEYVKKIRIEKNRPNYR